uniref:glycoprotein Xg n=1 Tax=Panthera onca TaxID=9690 RepID=UPI002954F6CC|nr:glycoprotein Xg [Panthera onca]
MCPHGPCPWLPYGAPFGVTPGHGLVPSPATQADACCNPVRPSRAQLKSAFCPTAGGGGYYPNNDGHGNAYGGGRSRPNSYGNNYGGDGYSTYGNQQGNTIAKIVSPIVSVLVVMLVGAATGWFQRNRRRNCFRTRGKCLELESSFRSLSLSRAVSGDGQPSTLA